MKFQNVIDRLKEILLQNQWKIATAESLTAGLVSSHLASISGSSEYLCGSICAYTIPVKVSKLGVDQKLAEACNAYSIEIAEQMAIGICDSFGTDIGISTTGYAEPNAEHSIHIPQAYITVSIAGELSTTQVLAYNMSRNKARKYIAKQALIFLLEKLEARPTQ